eukprot:6359464-Prymnesium_polylepis.1
MSARSASISEASAGPAAPAVPAARVWGDGRTEASAVAHHHTTRPRHPTTPPPHQTCLLYTSPSPRDAHES